MNTIFIKAPILGILTAFLAVVLEQVLALLANIFWQKEVILSSYGSLGFFLIAAVLIEEGLKYFSLRYVLENNFLLRGWKFVLASLATGFFFGLTEVWLVIGSNGNYSAGFKAHDPEMIFPLAFIILIQAFTALLIGSFIASRVFPGKLPALKILVFPVFIHLLFNFLIIQKGNFTNFLVFLTLGITLLISLVVLVFNFRKLD